MHQFLGLVTCLSHWNRIRVSLAQVFWKFQKIICKVSGMGLLKPSEVPEWQKCLCYYYNPWITPEFMLMRGLVMEPYLASGWRLVPRKTSHWLGWDFALAHPQGRGERLEIEFKHMVQDWINEIAAKLSGSSLLVNTGWEEELPSFLKLCVQDPPRSYPVCLFIWLVWFVSFIIKL